MEGKINSIKEHYEKNLKALEYHDMIHEVFHQIRPLFEFEFTFIHDVVHSGRFPGTKLLEIGSGATVYGIASASAIYSNIVLSDFVKDNREELKRWLAGESLLDWTEFLEYIAKLEGHGEDLKTGAKRLESRIRKNVKCVVKSDVLNESVVPLEELTTEETRPPYDLILTCLCLEAAVPDYEGYITALKRINKLLRPGGGLIICGFENGGYWKSGDSEFHHVQLTTEQVKSALSMAGFGKHHVKTHEKIESGFDYEYETLFCIAAEKAI